MIEVATSSMGFVSVREERRQFILMGLFNSRVLLE